MIYFICGRCCALHFLNYSFNQITFWSSYKDRFCVHFSPALNKIQQCILTLPHACICDHFLVSFLFIFQDDNSARQAHCAENTFAKCSLILSRTSGYQRRRRAALKTKAAPTTVWNPRRERLAGVLGCGGLLVE